MILLIDDSILEGMEHFHLRTVTARFSGQATALFRAQDGLNSTFADVHIQDDDSKFMQELNLYDLFANRYEEDLCLYPCHALFPSATFIIWTLSRPIRVTEGNKVEVKPATPAVQHV